VSRKIVIVTDPGIDGAFAVTLALFDPDLEVLGLAATAGNVPPEQATRNVHIVLEQLDPPRWPRLGAALAVEYDRDASALYGVNGLGGVEFPCARLHHPHPSDKLLTDLVRQHPHEVSVLLLGPPTVFARALDRDPDLPTLLQRLILVGGAWHEPGDAGPMTEFHFACDPPAARQVLRCGVPITLLPLDVTRKLVLSPAELQLLPADTRAGRFLRELVPHAIAPTASLYGVEGVHLNDVLGVAAVSVTGAFTTRPLYADVELRGELTRGVSVFDARWACTAKANVEVAVTVDVPGVRQYVQRTLGAAEG
jgi:inosine-uridine nucleoside N-ribohydrolase